MVLAEEKRDESGLKALPTSSDVFLFPQCKAESFLASIQYNLWQLTDENRSKSNKTGT